VYLQTTPYIYLLLRERVDMTRVQRSKKTSTTGHTTTCNLTPTGFSKSDVVAMVESIGQSCYRQLGSNTV
jgi:hypothetical protein